MGDSARQRASFAPRSRRDETRKAERKGCSIAARRLAGDDEPRRARYCRFEHFFLATQAPTDERLFRAGARAMPCFTFRPLHRRQMRRTPLFRLRLARFLFLSGIYKMLRFDYIHASGR